MISKSPDYLQTMVQVKFGFAGVEGGTVPIFVVLLRAVGEPFIDYPIFPTSRCRHLVIVT